MKIIPQTGILASAALAFWLATTVAVPASLAIGAQNKKWPANPAKHTITIVRTAADETEKKMIAAAEAAPCTRLVAINGKMEAKADLKLSWWNKEVLGVRIPYAVTTGAVEYYKGLVEDYQKLVLTRYVEPSSKFIYDASVKTRENFSLDGKVLPKVYVVKLKLSFSESYTASPAEAFQFTKEREVIVDPTGNVLQVSGDGDIQVPIMSI